MFRNLKKKIAAIMSLGLVLSTGAVMHAEAENRGSITINAPEGVTDLTGLTAKAYQVLKESEISENLYTVTKEFEEFFAQAKESAKSIEGAGQDGTTFYLVINDDVLDIVNDTSATNVANIPVKLAAGEKFDIKYFEASLLDKIKSDTTGLSKNMEVLSNWLTDYIGTTDTQYKKVVEGTDPVTSTTIENVPDGYYLIVCDVPQDIAIEQSLIDIVNGSIVEINLKANTQQVTKKVKNGESETFADSTTANMFDTLTYQITMPVTKITTATQVTSGILKDEIKHHKFVNDENFTIKIGSDIYTNFKGKFKKTKTDEDTKSIASLDIKDGYGELPSTNSQNFTITFNENGYAAINAAATDAKTDIVVTYNAVLQSDAVNENKNTANWTLTKGPYTYVGEDEASVYTYGIDITKTFSDNQTSTHAGSVEFEIYQGESASPLKVMKDDDGDYHVDNTSGTTTKLTPDASGNLVLTGLKEGTYTLKEVATANDFQLAGDVTIILNADDTTKSELSNTSSATIGENSIVNQSDPIIEQAVTNISMLSMTILNQKGFNLPSTGGAGTWMFAIGGILLFAGAAAVLVAVTRKKDA